jgi:hypothetical protein
MEKTVRRNDKEEKTEAALLEAIDVIIVLLEILACLTIKATSGWFHEIKGNFPKELKALVYKEYNDTPCLFNRFLRIS